MKRKILQCAVCLLLLGMAWGCSNDSETIMSDADGRNITLKSNNVWLDAIAEEVDGELVLLADKKELMASFESILQRQGNGDSVKVETITLVRKIASNNPNDTAVFIIGGGRSQSGSTVSSGVVLSAGKGGVTGGGAAGGKMFFSPGPINSGGDPTSVSCWGCGTGCFLEYYDIDGHKVPYCNSAGCGPLCDRIFD